MKTAIFICFFAALGLNAATLPEATVAERGPHHAVWQRVTERVTPYGRRHYVTNSYREIATGKNHLKGDQWVPSTPEITITASGFGVATQLQHKVIFAPNINTLGAIDCLTPDNKRLRNHVLGLAYTDRSTGQGVMIAEIKDSTGVLVANNQVLYPDAFDSEGGFRADIRYTVTLAGIEQDIILVESPPDPRIYGIQPENCRLEVYSEFVEFPEPAKATIVLKREEDLLARQAMVEPDLLEETLVFGEMRMFQGVAFRFGASEATIPMGKTWEHRENRQLLVERLDYMAAKAELDRLPKVARVQNPKKSVPLRGGGQNAAWASFLPRRPPQAHAAIRKLRPRQMAQANLPRQGFVLDYQLMTAQTNFTFRGDETYFVTNQVILSGTTTIEGGTVIKAAGGIGSVIKLQGPLNCQTTPFRPAIFTSEDDDTVGQIISGSTGSPDPDWFSASPGDHYGRMLDMTSNTNAMDMHDIHIRYAWYGIYFSSSSSLTLRNAQIGYSYAGIVNGGGLSRLRNVLVHDSGYVVGSGGAIHCENATFHRVHYLRSSTYTNAYLTNCLLIAVTNNVFYTGVNNETNNNDAGIFQTAAHGAHYLANSSPYRDAGTTNIDSTLLEALRRRTTHPPLLLTNDITSSTNLGLQAQRDIDAVDIGFHYLPVDWIVGGITVTGSVLTVSGGTTIAMDAANTNWGIRLDSGAQLISEGSPVNLNRFVRTHSVQEIPAGSGTSTAPLFADTHPPPASPVTVNLRFTEVPQIQRHFAFRQENNFGTFGTVVLRDSELRGGTNYFSQNVTNQFMAWTNVLFEDSGCYLYPYTPTTFHIRNCTFSSSRTNALGFYIGAGSIWSIKDCIFANVAVTNTGGSGTITHDYNGYLTNAMRLLPSGVNDVVLATNIVNFQAGALGTYYLPADSPFLNNGSQNATNAQLYHYCTTTNQAPETNSIVDIGFHYVALNPAGEPEDSNTPTNGVPNYIEDANGNGIVDGNETPYTTVIVALTSPTNGAAFNGPLSIELSASATAAFSRIASVEFYSGITLLGQDNVFPFAYAWNNPTGGVHTLTARALADAGIVATSAPVTITVYNALLVTGSSPTNLASSEVAISNRLQTLGFYATSKSDTGVSSNDANGMRLILVSKSVDADSVDDGLLHHATPLLCWEDQLYNDLDLTGNGSSNADEDANQTNVVVHLTQHPMAGDLEGPITVTSIGHSFGWGKPNSNALAVATLTDTTKWAIFGYESNALMVGSEAASRRVGFFLGRTLTANLTSNGWNLFDAAVRWVTDTNKPPTVNWVSPTNDSAFVASTNVALSATASDVDSGLKKVNFYRTGVRIGQADTVSQQTNFSLIWSNAIAGRHVLTAKAFDQGGLSSTSAQFTAVTILSNALFVTGSPTLNAAETNLKARIEGLGFVVTTKAAANVSEADALGKTVVVISSTSAAADVTNKFTYAPTPVVVWQNELFDDLGMTRTNASDFGIATAQTQISILTNHALAAGLGGTVSATGSAADFTWGTPGSNAIAIASIVGDSTKLPIFAYEKGVIMPGVGTNVLAAPARRVGFFLTEDTAVSLTSQGWDLFDAAILWAAAKPCSTSVVVMLALDVSNSLTDNDFVRAKMAASNFVGFLRPGIDQVGLVSFASNSILESLPTTSLSAVQAMIVGLTNRGGTLLEPPITMCQSNLIFSSPGVGRLLVMLSDGEINQDPEDDHRTNALNAAKAAKDLGIRIVTIGYDNNAPGLELLRGIASSLVDHYYSPDISELTDVYASVADTICLFDEAPSVTITDPIAGAIFVQPEDISIEATASDEHGQVTQVEFFAGGSSLGIDTTPPWSAVWSDAPTGQHSLTAVARDNASLSFTSAPVSIEVRARPTIMINTPTSVQEFAAPANVYISATASDSDGTVTNVSFFYGALKLAEFTQAPFAYVWTNLLGGNYTIRVEAKDNHGLASTSEVSIVVIKQPPWIQIHNPEHDNSFASPVTVEVKTAPNDPDGEVIKVEFFENTTSLRLVTNAPFHMIWTNVPAGSHTLRAVAWDNDGLTNISTNITFSVGSCSTNQIHSLLLSTATLKGGLSATGTVNLVSPAASGGQAVNLTATNSAISIPASVLVPEGQTNVTFRVDSRTIAQEFEPQIAANVYSSSKTTLFHLVPNDFYAANTLWNNCGPMDVAVIIDLSESMLHALAAIKNDITNIVNAVEFASAGDYRLALIAIDDTIRVREVFAMTNRVAFTNAVAGLTAIEDWVFEPTEEAINTIIHALPAEGRRQEGDFNIPFRIGVRRMVIVISDEVPWDFSNSFDYLYFVHNHARAIDAFLNDVQVSFLVPPSGVDSPVFFQNALTIGRDYAQTTGGFFAAVDPQESMHLAFQLAISQCGTSVGELVHIRNDERRLNYPGIFLSDTTKETTSTEFATFDLTGVGGEVRAARLNRTGQLRVNYGSHFDVQLGAESVISNFSSFAHVVTNAHAFPVGYTYKTEWELPFSFYPDIEAHLGGHYFLKLADRVSAACGNNFEVVDVPNADWPLERNFLTLKTVGRFEIPQGRCRDFVLTGTNAPTRDTWEVVHLGEVIACSCEPNGWSVERDHSVYSGFNICVPTNIIPRSGYEIRHKDALGTNSGMFAVVSQGALDLAPVLKPIVLDPPFGASNAAVNVTLELDAPARGDGAFITLTVSGFTNLMVPAYVHIPAGEISTRFSIPLPRSTNGAEFEITAFYNGYREATGRLVPDSGMAPQPPSNFQVLSQSDSIRLTWDPVPDAEYYEILRSVGDCITEPLTNARGVMTTCFVDYDVVTTNNYCYRVRAVNSYGSNVTGCTNENTCRGPTGRPFWPEIVPAGGKFNEHVWVTITNATPGISNYYALDGTEPTTTNFHYTGPFLLTTNTTVIAKAFNASEGSSNTIADFYISQATEIACGTNITALLGSTNWPSTIRGAGFPVQRYKFEGIRGYVTTIYVESPDIQPFLYLIDPSTNVVALGDPLGRADQIRHTLRTNGTYYIEVTTLYPHAEGSFSMSLTCEVSPELNVLNGVSPIANGGLFELGVTPTNTVLNRTLTISNSGTATLVVSNYNISPSVFSISPTTPQVIATNAFVDLTLSFLSQATGAFTGTLTFNSNDGDNDDGVANPFVLNLFARANRSGTAPLVTITVPITNQLIQAPTNQPLTAVAIPGASTIGQVDFYVIGSTGKVWIGSDLDAPHSVTWVNFTGGVYQVRAEVLDTQGRWNQSAAVPIIVNDRPVARNDRLGVLGYAWQEPMLVLANDTDANGDSLMVLSNTQPANGIVTNINGVLHYTSNPEFTGMDSFIYTVMDSRGGTNDAVVTVPIIPYDPPPIFVQITAPPGDIDLTGPTNIIGTVTNDYLFFWDLQYFRVGRHGRGWVTFASGTDAVTNGLLGTFDPTLLPNGIYKVKLVAVDFVGNATETEPLLLKVGEGPKVGHFTLAFTDLEIPVAGLPITLTRSYDSRATEPGDFGAGWKLDVSSVNLQKSGVLGIGWQTETASFNVCVTDDADPHSIAVNFPDKTYRFGTRLRLNYRDTPCTVANGLSGAEAMMAYVPFAGTVGRLEALRGPVSLDINFLGGDEITLHENRGAADEIFGPIYDPAEFVYTHLDGTRYEFNPAGQIVKMADRNGNTLTFGAGGIIHSTGKSVKFIRDTSGRIVEIYDPLGLDSSGEPSGQPAIIYRYDGAGNLTEVHRLVDRTQPNGYLVTKFAYEDSRQPHYITSIKDPRGITGIRNEYDATGRLVASVDAAGKRITYTHDLNGRKEIIVDRLGHTNIFSYDVNGNVTNSVNALGHTNSYTYDSNGAMLSHTDPLGNATTYQNDGNGNVLAVTLPYPPGADPAKYTTRYTYDQSGEQTSIILPTGGVITNKFDAAGNLLEVRDGAGNIIATNAYDALGLVIAEGDQFGALRFGHDAFGNATHMTNSLNQPIMSGYDANGDLTNLVENGVSSTFSYDGQGRDRTADYGNGITLTNNYDSHMDWTSVDGPTIGHMERRFDNQGRLAGWKTVNGSQPGFAYNDGGQMEYETNSIGVVTKQTYDAAGRLISVTNLTTGASASYAYDAAGRRIAETNALGHVTRFDYNPDGSVKSMTNAFGTNVWLYAYDTGGGCCGGNGGTTTTVIDPLGREVTDIRSPLGLPLQMVTKLGSHAVTNTTVYLGSIVSPDQEGEEYPASITDEGGRTRNFGYTPLGQLERASDLSGTTFWTNRYSSVDGSLLEVISPTGETNAFVYDDLDNVKTNRFPDGNLLINYYNAVNRLTSNALPSGSSVHLKYDSAGRITNRVSSIGETATFEYNGNDAVTIMTDDTGTTTNLYDSTGRLIGINYPTGASIRYEFDKLNRITALTNRASASGTAYATRYAYDAVGNITNVTDPFNGQTAIEYDRVGRRTKRTLPNGITTEWQYNWRDQVTNIVHKNSGATVLASVAYERAPFGEPTTITREDGSYVILKYDAALRLTNEQHYVSGGALVETIGYGYDASGSRIRLSNNSGTFTNAVEKGYRVIAIKRQSDGVTTETYTYDNGGRVTSINRSSTTLNLSYNTADQLTFVTNGANWTQYTHDTQGRRTKATDQSGAQRRFLVAGTPASDLESPHLIADVNNSLKQAYVYVGRQPIVRFDSSGSSSRVYYLEDGMGSIIGLAPAGSPDPANTTRLFYDGFGTSRSTNGPAPTIPNGTGGDFRFHAAWWESATDLYNMRAREYDSRAGRFTSRDPDQGSAQAPEGLHPYNYADCNAFVYSDPTGEFTMVEMNVVTFLQFTLQTARGVAVNEAKHWAIGKIGDAFGRVLLEQMEAFIPGFQWSRFSRHLGANPLGTGRAFDRAVKVAICKTIGAEDGVGDKIHMDVRVVNKGIRLGQPISAGNHCGTGLLPFDANTPVLGQTKGAKYSIPDMIIGPAPLVPPGGRAGTQRTYFIAEVKSEASSMYNAYVSPGRNKKQLQAILGYSLRNTETRIAFFIVAKNDLRRGLSNKARFYMMKRIIGFHALSHGVIPVLVKVR